MAGEMRKTGIDVLGDVPWGTHLCQFYQTREDLLDILAPYFKAGLQNNELCMWVTSEPLGEREARETMREAMPGFDECLKAGQIEIVPHTEWYLKDGSLALKRVLNGWFDKLNQALARGYDGMRLSGNTAWLEKDDWRGFTDYERAVTDAISEHHMIAICSYSLDKCEPVELMDVLHNHQYALIRREGEWQLAENLERKRAEEALRETSDYLNSLIAYANAPIIVWNPEFKITKFNPAFQRLTGLRADDVIGTSVDVLFPSDTRETAIEQIRRTSTGEKWESVEIAIQRTDGEVRIVLWNSANVYGADGTTIVGTIAQGQDITERKRAEEALEEYSERLEEMVERRTKELREAQEELIRKEKLAALGELAGGVSHELRNPLGVISNAAYFLKTTLSDADETTREYLELVSSEVRNAEKIISDLLSLSRTRAPERQEVAVSALVTQALRKQPPPRKVKMTTKIPSGLPPVFIDPYQIGQVLFNLVTNAYQAMPKGGNLTVSARAQQGQVAVSITDTGLGIAPENMAKIFEPLFTTRAKGIGLGLAVCRDLLEANGGSIEVQSEAGKGSTFTIVLPTPDR